MIKQYQNNIEIITIASLMIAMLCMTALPPASCHAGQLQTIGQYAIIIEQTPPDAGFVTPEPGVHKHDEDDLLRLRATPKSGFKFSHWLGDVEDNSVNETSVEFNAPKIVVAVFSRTNTLGTGGGGNVGTMAVGNGDSSLQRNPGRRSNPSRAISGGARVASAPQAIRQPSYSPQTLPDYQTPSDDIEDVPEPATLLTLAAGAIIAIRLKKRNM